MANVDNVALQLKIWNERFKKEGHSWGTDPSPTAVLLRKSLDELFSGVDKVRKIVTIGAGTYRDEVHLAAAGMKIKGFEIASTGVRLGKELAKKSEVTDRIDFEEQDFAKANGNALKGSFDALLCHRVPHLLTDTQRQKLSKKAGDWIKPGGLLAVSARDREDFNPDQMKWIDEEKGLAGYTIPGREEHTISFMDDRMLQEMFNENFERHAVVYGTELESIGNASTETHFTIYLARRKLQADIVAVGQREVALPKVDVADAVAGTISTFLPAKLA